MGSDSFYALSLRSGRLQGLVTDAGNLVDVSSCIYPAIFVRKIMFLDRHFGSKATYLGDLLLFPFVELYGQVNKRFRWMPWQLKAMKDVVACDKLRGVGKQTLLPGDFRMGKPT